MSDPIELTNLPANLSDDGVAIATALARLGAALRHVATSPRRGEAEQLAWRTLKVKDDGEREGAMCRAFNQCLHVIHVDRSPTAPAICTLCPAADMEGDFEWVGLPSTNPLNALCHLVEETLLNLANRDRIAFNTIRFGASFNPARVYTTLERLGELNALAEQFEQLAEPTL